MTNSTTIPTSFDSAGTYSTLWGFGLIGCVAVVGVYLINKHFLLSSSLSTSFISDRIERHLKRDKNEQEKLREALLYEQIVLYSFGLAEVVDCVTDWLSIFRMHQEVKITNQHIIQLRTYAFLGGCSLVVASWSLLQRAAIQTVINEEIHNDFIQSLEAGADLKDARDTHFVRGRNNTGQSIRESKKGSIVSVPVSKIKPPNGNDQQSTTSTEAVEDATTAGESGKQKTASEEADKKKLDEKSAHLAKEYAVIERKMLLMKISLLLLFVEDLPSILLNASVYIPQGNNIPFEALISVAISIGVIGYKISLFEKLKLMKKREADIEIVFKQLSESQLKDAKLAIMTELHKTNARLMKFNQNAAPGSETFRRRRLKHGGLQRKVSQKSFREGRKDSLGLSTKLGRKDSLGLSESGGSAASNASSPSTFNRARRASRDFASKITPILVGGKSPVPTSKRTLAQRAQSALRIGGGGNNEHTHGGDRGSFGVSSFNFDNTARSNPENPSRFSH